MAQYIKNECHQSTPRKRMMNHDGDGDDDDDDDNDNDIWTMISIIINIPNKLIHSGNQNIRG